MMYLLKQKPEHEVVLEKATTLILGIGNTLQCDDGLGVRAVERLATCELPADVEVRDAGTPGIDLVNTLQGRERVILIDAVDMGSEPGTWRRFNAEEVKLIAKDQVDSIHEFDIVSALEIADALNMLPNELIIYGVEPEKIAWGDKISLSVETALPCLVDDILNLVWKREE